MVFVRLYLICFVVLSLSVSAFAQFNPPSKTGVQAMASANDARARAMLYTGFDRQKVLSRGALSITTELTIIQEDNTPFLSDSIIGKPVWRVVVEGVRFDLPSLQGVDQQPTRTFEVLIDSATGRCFGAYSYFEGHDPDIAPEPPSDTATTIMRGSSEIWSDFPAEAPPVTLSQAMDRAVGSNPIMAKELFCTCVMYSYLGKPAKPVWSIIGRGIPPMDWRPWDRLRPIYTRNRMRTIVDATTGEPMRVNNQPAVMIRPGDDYKDKYK